LEESVTVLVFSFEVIRLRKFSPAICCQVSPVNSKCSR
jgi:hypothetical protein